MPCWITTIPEKDEMQPFQMSLTISRQFFFPEGLHMLIILAINVTVIIMITAEDI